MKTKLLQDELLLTRRRTIPAAIKIEQRERLPWPTTELPPRRRWSCGWSSYSYRLPISTRSQRSERFRLPGW